MYLHIYVSIHVTAVRVRNGRAPGLGGTRDHSVPGASLCILLCGHLSFSVTQWESEALLPSSPLCCLFPLLSGLCPQGRHSLPPLPFPCPSSSPPFLSLEPRPFPLGFPQTHPRDVPLRKMLHPSPTTLTLLVLQISAPNLFWDPHSHQCAFHWIPHITRSIWATRDLWVLSVLCSDPTDV